MGLRLEKLVEKPRKIKGLACLLSVLGAIEISFKGSNGVINT